MARSNIEVLRFWPLSNEYDHLAFGDEESVLRVVDGFRGEPMADGWVPLRVRWEPPENPVGPDTSTDFPGLQSVAVFSARAV